MPDFSPPTIVQPGVSQQRQPRKPGHGAGDQHSAIAHTPMAFVQAIVLAYEQRNMSPDAALQKAQIAPEKVKNLQDRITAAQMETLSDAAMRELDDEGLGGFSRPLPWGSYGMLARASLTAPTLGVALKRWCRHHGLLSRDLLCHVERLPHQNMARIVLTEQCSLGALREFTLVSLLRNLHGLASWYIDSRIALHCTQLPFAAPAHAAAYPHMFPGPLEFGAAQAALCIDAGYLDMPLHRDEAAMRHMLQRALPLTVRPYRRDRLLVQRVRQLLASQPVQAQSAQALCQALHMSARTLHRQLNEEGASLQQIKDTVRRERAHDLLMRTSKPIKQVAQAVGFGSEKSFMRAFKEWTGQSPAAYRRGS